MTELNKKIIKAFFEAIKYGNVFEWNLWRKELIQAKETGYQGDKNDFEEIIRYEDEIVSEPVKITIENGKTTYYYEDGLKAIKPSNTLSSIFPSKEAEEKVKKHIKNQKVKRI